MSSSDEKPQGGPGSGDGGETGGVGPGGNGSTPAPRSLSDEELIQALELGHTFPCYFPIVVIAKRGEGFLERLEATVKEAQGEAPYRIAERPSREGRYVSYRLEVHVDGAREALDRQRGVAGLDGVLFVL